ncbi:hypothetical protein T484DRAFT_1755545 [Baffinella frigidus]|nr:hypothetical protein T484DRAFT_1755545 [Cryptophyta sp. CCMP2293]
MLAKKAAAKKAAAQERTARRTEETTWNTGSPEMTARFNHLRRVCAPPLHRLRTPQKCAPVCSRTPLKLRNVPSERPETAQELKADEFSRSDGDAEEIRWLTAEWQRLDLNNKDHKDDILHEEKNPPPPGFAWVPKKVLRKNLIAKLRADGLLKEDEDEDPTAAGTPS